MRTSRELATMSASDQKRTFHIASVVTMDDRIDVQFMWDAQLFTSASHQHG